MDWWYFGTSLLIVAKLLMMFCSYMPKTSFVSRVLLMIKIRDLVIYTLVINGNSW